MDQAAADTVGEELGRSRRSWERGSSRATCACWSVPTSRAGSLSSARTAVAGRSSGTSTSARAMGMAVRDGGLLLATLHLLWLFKLDSAA